MNGDCRFCTFPEPWRLVHETSNFRVLMGLGPLAPGYALVITRGHISCMAAIPDGWVSEFEELVRAVAETQLDLYGSSLAFEHGRSGTCAREGEGEDLCFHAHVHLLPIALDLAAIVRAELPSQTLSGWASLRDEYATTGLPYVAVQDGVKLVHAETESLPPRYLRTKIAQDLGRPELADWAAFPSYSAIRREIPRFRAALWSRFGHGPAGKLVRDRVPELLDLAAVGHRTDVLEGNDARLQALMQKLLEEAWEVANSELDQRETELADVVEVVRAIAVLSGLTLGEVINAADRKLASHGGFERSVWLFASDKLH